MFLLLRIIADLEENKKQLNEFLENSGFPYDITNCFMCFGYKENYSSSSLQSFTKCCVEKFVVTSLAIKIFVFERKNCELILIFVVSMEVFVYCRFYRYLFEKYEW